MQETQENMSTSKMKPDEEFEYFASQVAPVGGKITDTPPGWFCDTKFII